MSKHHVIIGGGPVGINAVETIRQFDDGDSNITLVCDEPAHSRMALPYWLSGQFPREHTYTADDAWYQKLGVDARIGSRAAKIDPDGKSVELDDGTSLSFDTLLIATGARPAELPIPGADLANVQPLWTLDDTESLLNAAGGNAKPRIVMIGAGFIGFIMLNAMHKRGWDLTVIEREAHVLPRMLDAEAAGFVERWLGEQGVTVHAAASVQEIREADDGSRIVALTDGTEIPADVVIVATGITPNIELLDGSGIDVGEGILVDDHLRTNFDFIYAGGDVAEGPTLYGGREIHAIQPTAVDHGRVAGANMAGQDVAYPGSLSMNVLDACGLQNVSFGNWSDANAEATTIANPDGFVFRRYLWTDDEITGAIFVGRANDVGMLTDVGMVKGLMQTRTKLGAWKTFLQENPFDVRRPYIASGVAAKLAGATLLGRPSQPRQYRAGHTPVKTELKPAHQQYVGTK